MGLSNSQKYRIRRAKERRTIVLSAAISRHLGLPSSDHSHDRIIKSSMNAYLHANFCVQRYDDLTENQFDDYLKAIQSYRYFLDGTYI